MQKIKNIIFDLGGVIINLDMPATAIAFQQLAEKYGNDDYIPQPNHQAFNQFEIGAISPEQFREAIRPIVHLAVTDEELDIAWNAMLLDIPLSRLQLLQHLKQRFNIFLLSNTNEIHYHAFNKILYDAHGYKSLDIFFKKAYYSHLIKMRKPDAQTFQLILNENNLLPHETLFLDDTELHLIGAKQLNIQTEQVSKQNDIHAIFKNI